MAHRFAVIYLGRMQCRLEGPPGAEDIAAGPSTAPGWNPYHLLGAAWGS